MTDRLSLFFLTLIFFRFCTPMKMKQAKMWWQVWTSGTSHIKPMERKI